MKLTESQLRKVIRKVVNEQASTRTSEEADMLLDYVKDRGWSCEDMDQYIDWDEVESMIGRKFASPTQQAQLMADALAAHVFNKFQ